MPTSDSFDSDGRASEGDGAERGPDAQPPRPGRPLALGNGDDASDTHVHQVVEFEFAETPDGVLVSRRETLIQHRHLPEIADPMDLRGARPRRRPGRREDGRGRGGDYISFGSKSRMPAHMSRAQLEAYLKQERGIALEVRDPIAIRFAAERYNTVQAFLQDLPEGETVDLLRPALSVSQAAKVLGYNAKEVRRLLGQGKLTGRKVGSEWRIPLRAVL